MTLISLPRLNRKPDEKKKGGMDSLVILAVATLSGGHLEVVICGSLQKCSLEVIKCPWGIFPRYLVTLVYRIF